MGLICQSKLLETVGTTIYIALVVYQTGHFSGQELFIISALIQLQFCSVKPQRLHCSFDGLNLIPVTQYPVGIKQVDLLRDPKPTPNSPEIKFVFMATVLDKQFENIVDGGLSTGCKVENVRPLDVRSDTVVELREDKYQPYH
jgi:hypothetical protein